MQFDLFSTRHETFISVSTTALLLALALPTIVFVQRELARSLRGHLLRCRPVVSGAAGALTGLFIVGLYAEAIKASPATCIVRVVRNGTIVGEVQPGYWWAPVE